MFPSHTTFSVSPIPAQSLRFNNRIPRMQRPRSAVDIAQRTGPLDIIRNQRVLVLADIENLFYSARDLGKKVSFRCLANLFQQNTSTPYLYAFYSREANDIRRDAYFLERGWKPIPNDIQVVQTHRGIQRRANSDNLILVYAGYLISRSAADVICFASGDGELVSDLARVISTFPKSRTVVTLSLAGATSYQLNAEKNVHIHENIELGLDCLIPFSQKPISKQEVCSHV